jgi:cellulose synthase operon protein C
VIEQSLRALRRVGLRKEIAELLAEVERAVPAARLRTRLALAAGIASLGDLSRALPIVEQAHETLTGSITMHDRLELTRALAIAYSQTPLSIALHGIAALASQLRVITDSFGTNSHYCLSVLHFVDALVLGITSDDLVLGETGRRLVEDDEYLIRRRLHRDLSQSAREPAPPERRG